MNDMTFPSLSVTDIVKTFDGGLVEALRGITLTVAKGEHLAIMGPSGCGKSTLLSIIGALDYPTAGKVMIDGVELTGNSKSCLFRAQSLGFVFQFHHLIPAMTLIENVEAPLIAVGVPRKQRRERAGLLLSEVGLNHKADSFPNKISGGERQRVAIARGLINSPKLLLADEPTGNLDTTTGEAVINLLLDRASKNGSTVIIVTHNPEIAAKTDRVIHMRDGLLCC